MYVTNDGLLNGVVWVSEGVVEVNETVPIEVWVNSHGQHAALGNVVGDAAQVEVRALLAVDDGRVGEEADETALFNNDHASIGEEVEIGRKGKPVYDLNLGELVCDAGDNKWCQKAGEL